ncbi:hypothetical protein EMIT0P43_130200 [Pseudomonas jessenii]|jgi:hypothetical protein
MNCPATHELNVGSTVAIGINNNEQNQYDHSEDTEGQPDLLKTSFRPLHFNPSFSRSESGATTVQVNVKNRSGPAPPLKHPHYLFRTIQPTYFNRFFN